MTIFLGGVIEIGGYLIIYIILLLSFTAKNAESFAALNRVARKLKYDPF